MSKKMGQSSASAPEAPVVEENVVAPEPEVSAEVTPALEDPAVAAPPVEAVPAEVPPVEAPAVVAPASSEPVLEVDVTFDDAQVAAIGEAHLDPGEVRQELGLAKVMENQLITFSEAIRRASVKYGK